MIRFFVLASLLMSTVTAYAANPQSFNLRSGKVVPVIGITETTLHGSNEPALVLRYQTNTDFNDLRALWKEVEEVWLVFQKVADKRGFKAAVVEAKEKQPMIGVARGAGWSWKKGNDGMWHTPAEKDHSRVPKDEAPFKLGNIFGK